MSNKNTKRIALMLQVVTCYSVFAVGSSNIAAYLAELAKYLFSKKAVYHYRYAV